MQKVISLLKADCGFEAILESIMNKDLLVRSYYVPPVT